MIHSSSVYSRKKLIEMFSLSSTYCRFSLYRFGYVGPLIAMIMSIKLLDPTTCPSKMHHGDGYLVSICFSSTKSINFVILHCVLIEISP
jgi:hypothetical protein